VGEEERVIYSGGIAHREGTASFAIRIREKK